MKVVDNKRYIEVSDFDSYESLETLISNLDGVDKNDDSGLTPLCFAILNQVDPLYIVLLCTSKNKNPISDNNSKSWPKYTGFGANIELACNKGKAPLEMAIMAGNVDAIKILFGNKCVEVTSYTKTNYGAIIEEIQYENRWKPIFDEKGNYINVTVKIGIDFLSPLEATKFMVFDASSNPNTEILKILIDNYSGPLYSPNYEDGHAIGKFFNDYNYTPLMMATAAQNYDAVETILSHIRDDEPNNNTTQAIYEKHDKIMDMDGSDQSAYNIADSLHDNGLLRIFALYSTYVTNFITKEVIAGVTTYTAKLVTGSSDDPDLITDEDYDMLNILYNQEKLVLEIDGITVTNAEHNKDAISNAVYNNVLDRSKLDGWPWWNMDPDEEIGTIAFVTDTFAVDPDPSTIDTRINGKIVQLNVRQEWEKTYDRSKGYTRQQVPQPPFSLIYTE